MKKASGFWIRKRNSREVVLVESAIDAISFAQLHPDRICDVVSIGGVGVAQARQIAQETTGKILTIGFDCDTAGDQAAAGILQEFPQTQRLIPTKGKDWNEELLKSPLRFQPNPASSTSAPDFSFPSSRF
jgi:DNA primase